MLGVAKPEIYQTHVQGIESSNSWDNFSCPRTKFMLAPAILTQEYADLFAFGAKKRASFARSVRRSGSLASSETSSAFAGDGGRSPAGDDIVVRALEAGEGHREFAQRATDAVGRADDGDDEEGDTGGGAVVRRGFERRGRAGSDGDVTETDLILMTQKRKRRAANIG